MGSARLTPEHGMALAGEAPSGPKLVVEGGILICQFSAVFWDHLLDTIGVTIMNRPAAPGPQSALSPLAAILLGGVIAASIDIAAACLINGKNPIFILHVIAGGLLAGKSLAGGLPTALLGLGLQEFMGILIALIYVVAARFIPALRTRWIAGGIAYGIVVYFVMTYVVVPLSAWHNTPTFKWRSFLLNMAAMWVFGLIVAYFGSRARFVNGPMRAANEDIAASEIR